METADEQYAVRAASAILSSFMQQPQDLKTMLGLLTQMLVGMPKMVLSRMVDPRVGVATSNEFFSLAACKKWLNSQPELEPRNLAEHRLLPQLPEPEVSAEEKERRIAMSLKAAEELKKVARTNFVGRPNEDPSEREKRIEAWFRSTQRHNPEELLKALGNLREMKPETENAA